MLITCGTCSGTGSNGGVSCSVCGGDGEIDLTDSTFKQISHGDQVALTGVVWDLMLTKLDAAALPSGVFRSYQVFDVTDIPEYSALSGNNKATFGLIIHCGRVNLNDGSVKTALWAMFDSESTTRANYITLIG